MILYFSGTGNSKYIAERIAAALSDKVLNVGDRIKAGDTSAVNTGRDVIMSMPTYAWRIPRVASDWLEKTELIGAERIWFVMNCGDQIGNAAKYNRQLAEQKNLEYMGTAQIIMPENYIAMFGVPDDDEARAIVRKSEPYIDRAIACIKEDRRFPAPRGNLYDKFVSSAVNPIFYNLFVKTDAFKAGDNCTGCGLCVEKCPLNNIKINSASGKPEWGKTCTHCMACICYCPSEAIEYGKKSHSKPRYHFERL